MVEMLRALADANRLRLVELLLTHDLCVSSLAAQLEISESAVSQHLKVLRTAGLVRGEKRGYFTHYGVDRQALHVLAAKISSLASITELEVPAIPIAPAACGKCERGGKRE